MYGFIMAAVVIGGLWMLRQAGRMTPAQSRQFGMKIFGWALLVLSAFLTLHGNFLLGVPVFGVAAGLLGMQRYLPQPKVYRPAQAPVGDKMGRTEALNVLGLGANASTDEIKAAHKRLQRANHPDTGGSTYLAAKINEARDILLAR